MCLTKSIFVTLIIHYCCFIEVKDNPDNYPLYGTCTSRCTCCKHWFSKDHTQQPRTTMINQCTHTQHKDQPTWILARICKLTLCHWNLNLATNNHNQPQLWAMQTSELCNAQLSISTTYSELSCINCTKGKFIDHNNKLFKSMQAAASARQKGS